MQISPFVCGLALGGVGIAITILIANYAARRMADRYEERIEAKNRRIQALMGELQEYREERRRANVVRQIQKPIGPERP